MSGGHLPQLLALLTILRPGDISDRPLVQRPQATTTTRRRWGWGGGRDKNRGAAAASEGKGGMGGAPHAAAPPSSGGGDQGDGAEGGGGSGGWSGEVPVGRVRAALSLVSALVGCRREETGVATATGTATGVAPGAATGDKHGFLAAATAAAGSGAASGEDEAAADGIRAAVGGEEGLLQAVCELALASARAPAGGGATWAEYGLPEDCQRSALEILTGLVSRHPGNQVGAHEIDDALELCDLCASCVLVGVALGLCWCVASAEMLS